MSETTPRMRKFDENDTFGTTEHQVYWFFSLVSSQFYAAHFQCIDQNPLWTLLLDSYRHLECSPQSKAFDFFFSRVWLTLHSIAAHTYHVVDILARSALYGHPLQATSMTIFGIRSAYSVRANGPYIHRTHAVTHAAKSHIPDVARCFQSKWKWPSAVHFLRFLN